MREQPNLNYIKELSGGDKAFEEKFMSIVKTEFPIEKEEYLSYLEKKDYKTTSEIVHKMKHKFSILGMQQGYKLAVEYEENLKKDSVTLQDNFLIVLQTIERYIKTF
ncbi:MAG: Hpt domain-containing protein [Cellulophaga sp.]